MNTKWIFESVSSMVMILFVASVGHARSGTSLTPFGAPIGVDRTLNDPDNWLAVVGDSSVTGAASSASIQPTAVNLLLKVISFGLESRMTAQLPVLENYPMRERFGLGSIEPMTRVLYSQREFDEASSAGREAQLNLEAKASLKVDVQEHSFAYMTGRALGMAGRDIVLVGQDGKRVSAIPEQIERIYEMQTTTLPPVVLVSFVANDFCDEEIFTKPLEKTVDEFRSSLEASWKRAEPFLIPHRLGTRILVLGSLDVTNTLTNESLLEQRVRFEGNGEVSCRMVREHDLRQGYLTKRMDDALVGMCRSVLATKPTDVARLMRIRQVQSSFNDTWKEVIYRLNARNIGRGITWEFVETTKRIQFVNGDLANDCFHPSVGGHARIADAILRDVFGR